MITKTDTAPQSHPRAGEVICTTAWMKPIPTNKFDFEAWFDNDEPGDDGNGMSVGYGATKEDAIADLLAETDE